MKYNKYYNIMVLILNRRTLIRLQQYNDGYISYTFLYPKIPNVTSIRKILPLIHALLLNNNNHESLVNLLVKMYNHSYPS